MSDLQADRSGGARRGGWVHVTRGGDIKVHKGITEIGAGSQLSETACDLGDRVWSGLEGRVGFAECESSGFDWVV
jgi:hypothetical protein